MKIKAIFQKLICLCIGFYCISYSDSLDAKKYKYQLAIAMIFQNDAPYLREWIEFHLLVGAEHFWLYNNNSTDNYAEILMPYIQEGIVDLIDWPSRNNDWHNFSFKTQPLAYCDAIKKAKSKKHKAKWLALIDGDEFLFPTQDYSLVSCLEREYKSCPGVCVNWQVYGTSGVVKLDSNQPMIDQLLYKALRNYKRNHLYKSIVRPQHVKKCSNPHLCRYKRGRYHVNADSQRIAYDNPGIFIDKIRINHYWTRDEGYMYAFKVPRYQQWTDSNSVVTDALKELNQEYDGSILKYVPALKKRLHYLQKAD